MLKLLKYVKGYAIACAIIAPIMMFIEVYMDLMQPKLMSDIIDTGIANRDLSYVYSVGGHMLFVAVIGIIGGLGCGIFASIASVSTAERLRQGLFDKIQTLSFSELDKLKTSSLITRLTNDVTQFQNMLLMALKIMVRAPFLCIGGIIMAYELSPKLSTIFLIAIPIIVIAVIIILKKSFPLFLLVQQKIDKINVVMRENILGMRVIKAFTVENKQGERFDEANNDLMNRNIKAQNMNILLSPIVTFILNISVIGVLWFGGYMAINGAIEIGKIMAFINYLIQIMNSMMMVLMLILNISRAKASGDRINEVLETKTSIEDIYNASDMGNFNIEFRDVSFKYNESGDYVLKNINLTINEGEKVGIIGATGAGKSSLIGLIPRLYDVTTGEVLIGNKNVKEIKTKELRKNIGIVLQESILFSGDIEENLRFGNEKADKEFIEEAAKDAQAYEFIKSKEDGYKSIVEQRGKNLSGGQKQRLSIARTLVKNPKIFIMDDSSSALDMATESKLQIAIKNRMKDKTIVIIAQRISAVMDCNKIVVIDNGEVVAIGSHLELLQNNEIYRSIALSQLGEEVLQNG